MRACLIQLKSEKVVNLDHIVIAYKSRDGYWLKTTNGTFSISEEDFNVLQKLSL